MKIIDKFGLKIDPVLFNLLIMRLLGSNIEPDEFWENLLVYDLA